MQILADRNVEADVTEYLRTPPDRATLVRIADAIGDEPAVLVRKDKRFAELGLDPADYVTRDQVVDLLCEHPALMERPVVIVNGAGVIARPPEKLLDLLG